MLAVEAGDLKALQYPLFASTKLDGLRAVITPEGPKTRSLKPIPNKYVARMLATLPAGLDGELAVLDAKGNVDFRATTSAIRKEDGEPNFVFFVFDNFLRQASFKERIKTFSTQSLPYWCRVVTQWRVDGPDDVEELFEFVLKKGYEGLILRDPDGAYKHGRSTLKEQGMLKVKPWADAEAIIIDILPEYENQNEAKTNELGRTHRSSAQAGKVQREALGVMVVQSDKWKDTFEIGTGFTRADKEDFWSRRTDLIGETIRFSYVTVGGYDKPRHASFQGFRMKEDMS